MISADDRAAARAGIEQGFALPSNWYTDPEVFRAEQARIHRRGWHYVTHTGSLAEIGDNHLADIAGVPIVLVRDRAGEIRGFVNICRHRAHPVVMEEGNRKHLQCHYHGWSYQLDGALMRAPRADREPGFDTTDCGLVPVQVAVWGPMVWVDVDRAAPSFDEWIAGLPELMAARGFDVHGCVAGPTHTWDIGCNWKVFQDNTIECYHCPTTHPEFARLVEMDPSVQELDVGGRFWIHHRIPFRKGVDLGGMLQLDDDGRGYYHYNWIYPGTYLQYYGAQFDIGSVKAVAPGRIRFTHTTFVPEGTSPRFVAKLQAMLDVDPTIHQDVDICHRVQASHEAGIAPPGRLMPNAELLLTHLYRVGLDLLEE
jgi:phenylpropionate dioxygenase-like ring-hydroxylating dioxygenase large terminal subunit